MMNKTELREYYAAHIVSQLGTLYHIEHIYRVFDYANALADEALAYRRADNIKAITRLEKKHPRWGKFLMRLHNLKITISEVLG